MERRNFIQAGIATMAALFSGRSTEASPTPFIDTRRGSGILEQENKRVCEWFCYDDHKPGVMELVLLYSLDRKRIERTTAYYIPYRQVLEEDWMSEGGDFNDYDEATDTYWAPEGFYTYQSDCDYCQHVGDNDTTRQFFWMPLPKAPQELTVATV